MDVTKEHHADATMVVATTLVSGLSYFFYSVAAVTDLAEVAVETAVAMIAVSGLSSSYSAAVETDLVLAETAVAVVADATTVAASICKEEAAQCSPFYI